MDAKRGFVPEDVNNFSPESIKKMRTASRHIKYLLDEGYGVKQAAAFVGNHFLLSDRQRLAVMRSIASKDQLNGRRHKEIPLKELKGKEVWVDGFNIIITLEVLMSNSILLNCMDGTIRDLASLRGTYRLIPETKKAVRMIFDVLEETGVSKVDILLDEPVSNSGRLKALIADEYEESGFSFALDVQVLRNVDRTLYQKELVITSDSVILDQCVSWANLTVRCMKREGKQGIQVWQQV